MFRRYNSDDAEKKVQSADGESAHIESAIKSATESASTSTHNHEATPPSFAEASDKPYQAPARTEGFAPREPSDRPRYNDRGDRGGFGDRRSGDRGGFAERRGGGDRDAGFRDSSSRFAPIQPGPAIYVGNLLFDVTAKDLEREFAEFGTIKSATIATDPRGLSKG